MCFSSRDNVLRLKTILAMVNYTCKSFTEITAGGTSTDTATPAWPLNLYLALRTSVYMRHQLKKFIREESQLTTSNIKKVSNAIFHGILPAQLSLEIRRIKLFVACV